MSATQRTGLRVCGLSHFWAAEATLDGVGLTVAPGEVHSILGPSGSGKTTLMRLIAGLERVQRGRVHIDDVVVASGRVHLPPESRPVGLVFQEAALFPHLNVRDNVGFGLPGWDPSERRAWIDELLERVDLGGFADAMPHTLSGGQQQRVALVRALAPKPSMLLLDEPFNGLDAALRGEVRTMALDLLRERQVATLLVTHDAGEAIAVSDRLSVLDRGAVLQTGVPREVYDRPVSLRAAELLGPVNVLERVGTGRPRVDTPWGPVPVRQELSAGSLRLLWRPSQIRLRGPDSESDEPGAAAVVRRSEFRGDTTFYELELSDGTHWMALHMGGSGHWRIGARVRVVCDPAAAVVVPPSERGD